LIESDHMTKKRLKNGKQNDRKTIKVRQSLDFKSWIENVRWNQEAVGAKQEDDKINIDPIRED